MDRRMIAKAASPARVRTASGALSQALALCLLVFLLVPFVLAAADAFGPKDVLRMKSVATADISPDGAWIAYTVRVPRKADEAPGGAYSELYVISTKNGQIRPFITGKVNVRAVAWHPEGRAISFLMRRGEKATTQVWMIPIDGGEAKQITFAENSISSYKWHPSGEKIGYLMTTPKSKRERALEKKGYEFIYYEENLRPRNFYLVNVPSAGEEKPKAEQLTHGLTAWSFEFSPDGKKAALAMTEHNLIDERYMFQQIYLLDLDSKNIQKLTNETRKLGNYVFSPDGAYIAYAAALDEKDNQVSQAFVMPAQGGEKRNITIPDFRGHVSWVGWKDKNTVFYFASEGTHTTLSTVKRTGGDRKVILHSKNSGIIFGSPSYTRDFKHFAFIGQTPQHPGELFAWNPGGEMKRLTVSNPWLAEKQLGRQEVIQYTARDGLKVEGILIYPAGYEQGKTYPLVVTVHGGPESHYSNGWLTGYSRPGQVLANKGYAVFYPNYRSSTGYGVKFAMGGWGDPAGKEFDDIADGIEHLIKIGIADRDRVGLGGGSYGGYASAWFATYYTKYVKAVCMFVGISDVISKRGSTDIPYEMMYVHHGRKLEEMWDISLKRSPIYYAHQSKTATLIFGGKADTRVDPSQSLELYRRMKMNHHPAVRLVQYPGEGHGNRRQPGRIDVLYRILDWYDWYVKDAKPLDGPMPPLDISDKYGIKLPPAPKAAAEATN